jgi:hypothetical protein
MAEREAFEAALRAHKVATTPELAHALQVLKQFVGVANSLSRDWPDGHDPDLDVMTEGYPDYLPSFDEFVNDLQAWYEKAHAASR